MDETDKLYEDTRSIYEKFTPNRVKPIRNLLCDRAAAAQWLFSTVVLSGRETHGIELNEPTYKYVAFSSNKQSSASASGDTLPRNRWSVSSDRQSLSGSRQNLASAGSVREDRQQASAPTLPPREDPRGSPKVSRKAAIAGLGRKGEGPGEKEQGQRWVEG